MRLTHEQIAAVRSAHGKAEAAHDVEATMETVGPNPLWEWQPVMRFTTRDAVGAAYQRMYEHVFPHVLNQDEHFRAETRRLDLYSDDGFVIEDYVRVEYDGQVSDCWYVTLVECDDDGHFVAERSYVTGALVTLLEEAFAPLRGLPGVVDLKS